MLIVTRKAGQCVYLSNIYDAEGNRLPDIKVVTLGDDKVGIDADLSVCILRDELYDPHLNYR
ncbi:carbon storage regulator [Shewanella acanthi]|uniref:carbon storage regulator n=1 Tax=Shewanella acanthi TaxID=2864212 RepID=UPI001C6608B6|nr:carbon storage regulator [Shewanella acanthi]QYJ80465.1 carbon storage regulator [Shewanella acanthi]